MTQPIRLSFAAVATVSALVLASIACLDPTASVRARQREERLALFAAESKTLNQVGDLKAEVAVVSTPPEPHADSLDAWASLAPGELRDAVAAEIAFEPYAGVLRGPEGTAAVEAGNAWDDALLIGTLLARNGHAVRYAYADLPDDAVTALLAPFGDPAPLRERVRHHVWVEVEQAGAWLALDPTAPGQAGSTWTPATEVSDTLRPEAFQRLDVALMQRTVGGEETRLADLTGTVAEWAAAPFSLVEVGAPRVVPAPPPTDPNADPTGLGDGLGKGLTGLGLSAPAPAGKPGDRPEVRVRRTLSALGTSQELPSTTIRVADPASAVAYEWLAITLHVPGEPDRLVERPLSEAAPAATLRRTTVGIFPGVVGDEAVAAASAAIEATTPPGEDEASITASEQARGEAVGRFVVIAAAAATDAVTTRIATQTGVSAVRHQPRIYVASSETVTADGTTSTQVSLDLGLDEVEAWSTRAGASQAFQQGRGIAASTVEGEVLQSLTGTTPRTTAEVFQQAAIEGIGLLVLDHPDLVADLSGLTVPDAARIAAPLHAGHTIIVPERAVTLDGHPTWGWWDVDPVSGAWVGVLEGGRHQAVLEYTIAADDVLSEDRAYVMGLIVGAVATEGLMATMAVKYEFAEITPEIAKEIADTLESIVCKVCPSAGVSAGGGISVGTDCYTLGELKSGASAGAKISFCDSYLEGVKCSMSLVLQGLQGQVPGVSGSSGASIDIPFSCGGD